MVHAWSDRWQFVGGADYRGRLHANHSTFDFHELDARAGIGYVTGASRTQAQGRAGRLYIDDTHLRNSLGVSVDWLRALDDRHQLGASLSYTDYRFVGALAQVLDYDAYAASTSWSRAFAEGRGLVSIALNAGHEVEEGGRLDGDKLLAGVNLSLQGTLLPTIGGFVSASYQRENYQQTNSVFEVQRHDDLLTASAGATWTFFKGWSLRPQVTWSRNDSNIELSDHDRLEVSLNLRKEI